MRQAAAEDRSFWSNGIVVEDFEFDYLEHCINIVRPGTYLFHIRLRIREVGGLLHNVRRD